MENDAVTEGIVGGTALGVQKTAFDGSAGWCVAGVYGDYSTEYGCGGMERRNQFIAFLVLI